MARVIEAHGLSTIEAASGVEALAVLRRYGEIPLCISDVTWREMDGVTFLRVASSSFPDMAIIMLTGVADVTTAVECLKLGALDYIAKPVMMEEVRARLDKALEKRQLVLQNRFYQREPRVACPRAGPPQQGIADQRGADPGARAGSERPLHQRPLLPGEPVRGEDGDTPRLRGRAAGAHPAGAELHDIGKIGTRERFLNKPGPLTAEEFEHIKEHTTLGERIVAPFLSESAIALRIVRSHHERMDGRGFPDGMEGEAFRGRPGSSPCGRVRRDDDQPRVPPVP